MKRREFVLALGSAAAWPLAARAQHSAAERRVGVLMPFPLGDPLAQVRAATLVRALAALDWREGDNLRIDWRWPGVDPALFERYAAELVAIGPDVLVAQSTPAVEALRRQTSAIPIVFAAVTDPVAQQFVESLARPGGNVTGFTDLDPPMASKWLGMLTQITPSVSRTTVLYNPATAPFAGLMLRAIEQAAPSFDMAVRIAPCRDEAEMETVIAGIGRGERGGLLVLPDIFTSLHRDAIIALVARHRLPAMYWNRTFVESAGLMSYGVDYNDLVRRAAGYVDRILRGDKPAGLPVQQPTKFELVINLKTARALDITLPTTLIAVADEVIE